MTKPICLLPQSDHAKRLAGVMHRKLTTRWSETEVKSFRKLLPIDEDDLVKLERYYRWHWPPNRDKNMLRHNLLTLLNFFQGEVDRATIWAEKHPPKTAQPVRKIIPLPPQQEEEMSQAEREQAEAEFARLMGRKPQLERKI